MSPRPPVSDGRAGERSLMLMTAARRVIPGGVNSPVRAFAAVGGEPPFIASASGSRLRTVDDAELVDYVGSWGPALLGHAHPEVVEAVHRAARDGLSFGAVTPGEVALAERLCEVVPALRGGKVRLVCSGTEATMSALRAARGFTGRDVIVKMDGGYHGHADQLLAAAGSGAATLGLPGSDGVPKNTVADTWVVPYNDADALARVLTEHGDRVAAVIVEPVAGNMGCVPPKAGYLQAVRELTLRHGVVLVFDEVITGFRLAPGGAHELYGIAPDLVCLGKILGGGLPLGAYGGRAEIMAKIAPEGPVYQAGTLSGNPLGVAAALATLDVLARARPWPALEHATAWLVEGLGAAAARRSIPLRIQRVGSMFTAFFQADPVVDYPTAKRSDVAAFARFHRAMLTGGIYLPPSQFEACFVSTAHDRGDLELTLDVAARAFAEV